MDTETLSHYLVMVNKNHHGAASTVGWQIQQVYHTVDVRLANAKSRV